MLKDMRKIFTAMAIILVLAGFSLSARADIIDFLFPGLRDKGPDPAQTLQAPFADIRTPDGGQMGPEPQGAKLLPENSIPLELPHRSTNEISDWLVTAASESMTFQSGDYSKDLAATAVYFDEGGRKQFEDFLAQNNILKVLETGKYHVRSFVKETPLLLNEGAVGGRYRWLFEVPLMLSYMDRANSDYKSKAQPVNQLVKLTVQIGRSDKPLGGPNVVIERWFGKAENISKK